MDVRAFVVEHLATILNCNACPSSSLSSAIFIHVLLIADSVFVSGYKQRIKMAEKGSNRDSCSRVTFRQNKLVGIEYPGYVENVQTMLQTLGGEEAITQTNNGNPTRLELSFRPGDPYCHPMCGDRFPTSNLLLRVRKKRRKRNTAGTEEVKYEQEILGIVDTTFRYESLFGM